MTGTTDSTAAAIAATPEIAVELVKLAIRKVDPGPEAVTAVLPAGVIVDWGDPGSSGSQWVTPPRRDKMQLIRAAVRARLDMAGVLVKLPQILLVADDGIVIELLGGARLGITVDL